MSGGRWKPQQYEPNRAEKCASPYNDYQHMPPWNRRDGWCPLCGQMGISEPAVWWALREAQERIAKLEGELRDRAAAAHVFGAMLGRDSSGHTGDFFDCQNGRCIEARAVLAGES